MKAALLFRIPLDGIDINEKAAVVGGSPHWSRRRQSSRRAEDVRVPQRSDLSNLSAVSVDAVGDQPLPSQSRSVFTAPA